MLQNATSLEMQNHEIAFSANLKADFARNSLNLHRVKMPFSNQQNCQRSIKTHVETVVSQRLFLPEWTGIKLEGSRFEFDSRPRLSLIGKEQSYQKLKSGSTAPVVFW